MLYLRQSTASQSVVIGPFVDSTDGNTAETALTVDAADIRLSKNGANIVGKNSGGGTHDELGYYTITLDATDTDTVGRLQLMVHESGALPVYHEFQVLEEATFDMLFASSALGYIANAPVNVAQFGGSNGTFASGRPEVNATHWAGTAVGSTTVRADLINIAGAAVSTTTAQLGVNAVQISGDGTAADNVETAFDGTAGSVPWLGIIDQGTAQAGSGTTIQLRAAASFADDQLNGMTVVIVSGTGAGQARLITDWVSATDTATVDTWQTNPDNTSVYRVYGTAPSSGGSAPSAATVAAAVWDASQASHTTGGTFGELATEIAAILVDTGTTLQGELDGIQADTEDIQSRLPAALVGGRIDATVDGTGMEAGAVTAIQSGLATSAALATLQTTADAIEADTQNIQSRIPAALNNGVMPADVQRINDIEITGDGQVGTEFGVA